jgi:hypothetical protein
MHYSVTSKRSLRFDKLLLAFLPFPNDEAGYGTVSSLAPSKAWFCYLIWHLKKLRKICLENIHRGDAYAMSNHLSLVFLEQRIF